MKRLGLVTILLCAAAASTGRAQNVYLNPGPDSVLAIRAGASRTADLYAYVGCNGITGYDLTLHYDDSRVHFTSAQTLSAYGFPDPTVTPGSDRVTLAASGATGSGCVYTVPLARITWTLDAGATEGSLIDVQLNSLTGYPSGDLAAAARTDLLEVCTSVQTWGDLDNNGLVTSRDALITLTAAVRLPVTGYDTTTADVDDDKAVTTRDALFILSAGIGINTGTRAGRGIVARCAPLLPSPADLVFFSNNGMEEVIAGDTVRALIAPTIGANQASTPRWSPDGTKVLYECLGGPSVYYQDLCTVDPGTGATTILQVGASQREYGPDWAPDGSRVSYVNSSNYLYTAKSDGTGAQLVVSGYVVLEQAWSPDGTGIAFAGWQVCCTRRLYTVNVDGTSLTEIVGAAGFSPTDPTWSSGGDSLTYTNGNTLTLYRISVSAGTAGTPVSILTDGLSYPDWVGAGIGFRRNTSGGLGDIYFRRASDGRHVRLTHGTTYNGDKRPDLRRTGAVYVNAVAISPSNPSVAVSGTTGVTATVTNSDDPPTNSGATVTWTSRNTGVFTVASTGPQAATLTGIGTGSAYLVATVSGWRSDSTLVTVP
ncbi:MAG: hypothetical protein HY700_16195 [Gemmatimonadetes bacterium]|nr:hypothetical protein [Gemmatimonadota bacterium]